MEVRGDEVVISRPKIEGSYAEYYATTHASKLKKSVDIKEIIGEVVERRHVLH